MAAESDKKNELADSASGTTVESSAQPESAHLTSLAVGGYKSIRDEQCIELRPLTILAGANSSGKSSIMQPLLLMKQTLDAPYDPGALKLDGPNVHFTAVEQLLSRTPDGKHGTGFHVVLDVDQDWKVAAYFQRGEKCGFEIPKTIVTWKDKQLTLKPGMSTDEVAQQLVRMVESPQSLHGTKQRRDGLLEGILSKSGKLYFEVAPERCFLTLAVRVTGVQSLPQEDPVRFKARRLSDIFFPTVFSAVSPDAIVRHLAQNVLRELIHLPGLRGNPKRTYPASNASTSFPGVFQDYVASIISRWQDEASRHKLEGLNTDVATLGLTWSVKAKRVSDAEVEIRVGRLPQSRKGGARDLVSIADVGIGVSQVLPVIVALHAAGPNNLVYIEQPEIHLHPRAQVAMAQVLARAVKRGVRIVCETHSPLLLLAVQALVAEGTLPTEDVILHWFTRSEADGTTTIDSAELDEAGAFGPWPEDFADVEAEIENRYLSAAEARLFKK